MFSLIQQGLEVQQMIQIANRKEYLNRSPLLTRDGKEEIIWVRANGDYGLMILEEYKTEIDEYNHENFPIRDRLSRDERAANDAGVDGTYFK